MHAVSPVCVWYLPAAQAVHDVAREQPAALYRPAGQSAQVLHLVLEWQPEPGHLDRPVSYCPAPHPLYP